MARAGSSARRETIRAQALRQRQAWLEQLVGLLLVAISVTHERLTAADAAHACRVRARAALTAFVNALTVSRFAVVPGVRTGWPALVVPVPGLLFVAASLLSPLRVRRSQPGERRDAAVLVGLVITFAIRLLSGLMAALHLTSPARSRRSPFS